MPPPNTDFAAIVAGYDHSLGLKDVAGDISGDKAVDLVDYSTLAGYWLNTNCEMLNDCSGADFKPDGDVDYDDLKVAADNWLAGK